MSWRRLRSRWRELDGFGNGDARVVARIAGFGGDAAMAPPGAEAGAMLMTTAAGAARPSSAAGMSQFSPSNFASWTRRCPATDARVREPGRLGALFTEQLIAVLRECRSGPQGADRQGNCEDGDDGDDAQPAAHAYAAGSAAGPCRDVMRLRHIVLVFEEFEVTTHRRRHFAAQWRGSSWPGRLGGRRPRDGQQRARVDALRRNRTSGVVRKRERPYELRRLIGRWGHISLPSAGF